MFFHEIKLNFLCFYWNCRWNVFACVWKLGLWHWGIQGPRRSGHHVQRKHIGLRSRKSPRASLLGVGFTLSKYPNEQNPAETQNLQGSFSKALRLFSTFLFESLRIFPLNQVSQICLRFKFILLTFS